MLEYFIKIWEKKEDDQKYKILCLDKDKFFSFLQNNKDSCFSVYEAKCVLDWS